MNSNNNNQAIRANSRLQLLGHYGSGVMVTFVIWAINMGINTLTLLFYSGKITLFQEIRYDLMSLITACLTGLLTMGASFFYLNLTSGRNVYSFMIFQPFQGRLNRALELTFFFSIIKLLSEIPYIVLSYLSQTVKGSDYRLAGAIALASSIIVYYIFSLFFSQAFFIFFDLPGYSFKKILKMSIYLMKGNKLRLFKLQLSFIPLYLLGILSCGIGMLWILPYTNTCMANFYLTIVKEKSKQS